MPNPKKEVGTPRHIDFFGHVWKSHFGQFWEKEFIDSQTFFSCELALAYTWISIVLDWHLKPIFCNFFTIKDIKKQFYYHLNIFQKYEFSQNLMVVAQKLSPPCPFQFWNSEGRGSPNFWVTPFKFWSVIDLL